VDSLGLSVCKKISDVGVGGTILSELGHDDGVGGSEVSESCVPVTLLLSVVVVWVSGVSDVSSGDGVTVAHSAKVECPVESVNENHVVSTSGSDGVVHLLHASVGGVSAFPHAPRNVVGLVVELEDDPVVGLVSGGDGLPQVDGAAPGHVLLTGVVVPVQVNDDTHTKGGDP
jgi:hypothetical protein